MYKTIEAIYQEGEIIPLEQIEVKEKSKLLIIVMDNDKKQNANWKGLRGKYKHKLTSVDDFISGKHTEKQLEL